MATRRHLILLLLLLLAGFALRMFRLDAQSIWWDEGISLHLANSPLAEILRNRLDNIHPPLYFMALKLWVGLVGDSPFTARYSSVLASWLQISLVWAYSRALVRRRMLSSSQGSGLVTSVSVLLPWLAAGLAVISAIAVIYGQEVRVYAFLPLVYLALLWAAERILLDKDVSWRAHLLLAVFVWLGIHLHYVALFGVLYVALWGTVRYTRLRRWRDLGRWVATFLLAAVASLPWFVAVLLNWNAVQTEASAGTFATEAVTTGFLLAQVWAFQLTGLAGALSSPFVRVLALVSGILFLTLVSLRLLNSRSALAQSSLPTGLLPATTTSVLRQVAHWAIPLTAAMLLWSLRSFSHPRYTIMYTIAFLPLVAVLVYPLGRRWGEQIVAGTLLAGVVVLNLWGIGRYFFDSNAAKADMRGVARYLQAEATADGLILIPDTDWSFPFEYEGVAPIVMATLGDRAGTLPVELSSALECETGSADPTGVCGEPRTVYVVDYERGTRDWQLRLPFELERRGTLVESTFFDELRVDRYQITHAVAPLPACDLPEETLARFGPLQIHDVWLEQSAAADSAVAVALCWSLQRPVTDDLNVTLLLDDDQAGRLLAQTDRVLLDSKGRPTTEWVPDEPVLTYHLLPLPVGTPPLVYQVSAGVYAQGEDDSIQPLDIIDVSGAPGGRFLNLGETEVQPGDPQVDNPYHVNEPARLPEPLVVGDLRLLGYSLPAGSFRPGQDIPVELLWEGPDRRLPANEEPAVTLMQDRRILAEASGAAAQGRYPTSRWAPGEPVNEVRYLPVPVGASGEAAVVLSSGSDERELAVVELAEDGVSFVAPVPEHVLEMPFGDVGVLVGFDLPRTELNGSEPVPITLYWRAQRSDIATNYVVFAHLIGEDGRLIGQHDGQPANGLRPTSEWLAGEYVSDPHAMQFREPDYRGRAYVDVGLYDPETGVRLATAADGDALRLSVELEIGASAPSD